MAIERYAEQLRFANASGVQLDTLERYKKEALDELHTRAARRDIGQKEMTIERLHESSEGATRIYVDGKPRTLAVNHGRTDVKAVLPENVRREKEHDALRVKMKAEDLKEIAERIFERLKRDGHWQ